MPPIGSWSRSAPDEADDLDVRVAGQQPDQLATDIAGRPDDPDPQPPWSTGGSIPRSERGSMPVAWLVGIGWTAVIVA